jgi:CrcB protein
MINLLLVAIGGALGACSRYIFIAVFPQHNFSGSFSHFPLNTMLVNIIGSFLMGVLHFFLTNYLDSISHQSRLLLATGVLGGFTTFSAFSFDVFRLINNGQIATAFIYIFSSVIFSIMAIFIGYFLLVYLARI